MSQTFVQLNNQGVNPEPSKEILRQQEIFKLRNEMNSNREAMIHLQPQQQAI